MKPLVLGLAASLALAALAGTAGGAARFQFRKQMTRETAEMLSAIAPAAGTLVSASELEGLPRPVSKYLRYAAIVGKRRPRWVLVRQRGQVRLEPGEAWMPASSERNYTLDPLAFVGQTWANAARFVPLATRDMFFQQRGHVLTKLAAALPVVDAHGPEADQSTLLRYLAEAVWFPHALVSPAVSWQALDATSSRVSLTEASSRVSGVFRFAEGGEIQSFSAERHRVAGEGCPRLPWRVSYGGWEQRAGVHVPTELTARWRLASGDFTHSETKLVELAYDLPWPRRGSRPGRR